MIVQLSLRLLNTGFKDLQKARGWVWGLRVSISLKLYVKFCMPHITWYTKRSPLEKQSRREKQTAVISQHLHTIRISTFTSLECFHHPTAPWPCLQAGDSLIRKCTVGTSLVVQWLRICLSMQGTQIRSLVRKLRSHMPWGN